MAMECDAANPDIAEKATARMFLMLIMSKLLNFPAKLKRKHGKSKPKRPKMDEEHKKPPPSAQYRHFPTFGELQEWKKRRIFVPEITLKFIDS